ncbi:MAG: protease modulator HflC [Granulosicoccus sp.]
MSRFNNPLVLVGLALLLMLVSAGLFTVGERDKVVKLRLGQMVEGNYDPGLHFKIPVFETIRKFDSRILTLDVRPERVLTSEKKNVIVDSFIKWRIADARTFYTRLGGIESRANSRLTQFVRQGVKDAFGKRTVQEVVSSARSSLREEIQVKINTQAENLGIEIVDVRIKKVELPDDVRESVFQRMEKDRSKIAREIRSEGEERAKKIRAAADRIREQTLATAYAQAEQTRGVGDAESARVYAEAYSKNSEFYSLYRSLGAYRKSFSGNGDVLLLQPDSEFFKYFSGPGTGK